MIENYEGFCDRLLEAGFSMGGGNDEGVFSLLEHGWNEQPPGSKLRWHTGDPDTDPWEWRMRVLDERTDIAYGKVFFKKAGYITRDWYPYFLAARRNGASCDERYADGAMSHGAKRIYDLLRDGGVIPLHNIKQLGGFAKEDKSEFERALIELQMGLFITMCGNQQKVSLNGQEYGWASTLFCTTEAFWGEDVFRAAADMAKQDAADAITRQIYRLNPSASQKKAIRFIYGNAS